MTPLYTREMQELLRSTVDNYEPKIVLNLDEDETTNFAGYEIKGNATSYIKNRPIMIRLHSEEWRTHMKLKVQKLLCLILASALLVGAIPIRASANSIHIDTSLFCNSDAEVYANGTFYSIHGKLFQEYDDGSRTCVFEREVEQIAADRDALYVLQNDAAQWKLLRLSFAGKIDDIVLSSDSEIIRFAVTKEYIYYLTNETLYAHNLTSGESKEILKKDNLSRFWLVDAFTIEYIAGNDDLIWRYEIDTKTTTSYVNVKSRLHEINDSEYQLTSNSNGVTLSSLKSKYPSGAYWNHSGGGSSHNNPNGYTYTPCGSCHGRNTCPHQPSDCYCNKFDGGVQCMGFALKLAYDYYESSPRSWSKGSLSTLKAGDYIRYKNNGHSIWVTSVNGDTITYADCNSDGKCGIRWDKTVSKSTVASSLTEVKSAPYSLETGSSYEIDTRYPTPIVANTLLWNNPSNGKTPVYKSVGDTVVSDYIYNGYNNVDDECTIHEIYTNGWCKISIPGINGYRYCEKDVFFNMYCDYAPWWVVAQQDIDAFRRWDHGSPRGYVAAGDNVCVVSETEQMYQVVFPTSSGNRCRWVDRCLLWHVYEDIVTAPTCTSQGYTTHKCKFCSNSYKDSYTNPLGHSYNYKVAKNPTTSATGTIKGTCSKCSGTTTVTLPKLNTTDYTYKITKAATCSAAGTGRYTWKTTTYGNYYFDVSIAKTGHSYSYKATKAPTTSATGTLTGTCSKCAGTTTVTLPKLNTTDYTYKVTKAATCTATGTCRYTWKTTTYGNYYFDVSIAATGHSYTSKVTAPTCTEQGYTTHTCACGHSYKDSYTPATGHSYSYKTTKAPSTSATGTLTGTCAKCSGTTTVTLPKLNTTDYTYKVTKAATCTASGTGRYTWKTTTYGSFYFDVSIAATGHSYGYKATKVPTTSATGTLTGTCSKCSGTTTVTLPKLNTTDYTYKVTKAATCTAAGTGRYTWKTTIYGNFYFDMSISATGHSYTSEVIAPTCTEQGYTTHTCSTCGSSYKDTYTAATGHSYSYKTTNAPTTSATGTLTGICTKCSSSTTVTLPKLNTTDYSYSVIRAAACTASGTGRYTWKTTIYGSFCFDVSIAALGHNYVNGICTRCGAEDPAYNAVASGYSGSLTWELDRNGVLTFSGEGKMKNYTYKSEMPWYPYFDQITSVVLEEGVTSIGDYAFYGMPSLLTISIPESVTTIGEYAFKNCPVLDNVQLPGQLNKLGESAFYACSGLTAIEIPASLWTIQPYTFKNCTALAEVIFHEGNLMKISDGAFYNTAVTELVLPDCLSILDVYSFKNCAKLESITLGSGLSQIREAVFYSTAIPTIVIPEGITSIGPYAFKNCVELETIDLPESLTSVGEASFYACTNLQSLELPDAVTTIGNYAFRKCEDLRTVTFSDSLVNIGESSFYGCESLFYLDIPENVTTIQGYAFKGCLNLGIVELPDSLKTLGESAFHTCTGLDEITIPGGVTKVGEYCFSGSTGIDYIYFLGDAPAIGTGAFNKISATAYYPSGNATWTSAVRQNYGGTITWTAQ